jgi:hypothetical protein
MEALAPRVSGAVLRSEAKEERTMKKTLLVAMFLGGCAASNGEVRSSALTCGIADQTWASADRDFDRNTTIEQLHALKGAAQTDRDKLKAGAKAEVGDALDQLYRKQAPSAFVGKGVAELGNRLRQLDCGVRADKIAYDVAVKRYEQILGELGAEQATLEPGAGTPRAATP